MTQFPIIASFAVSVVASIADLPQSLPVDESALIQSDFALRQELFPEAAPAKNLFVELTSFMSSTLIMSFCLIRFVRWATDTTSLAKLDEVPTTDASSSKATDSFTHFLQAVDAGDIGFCTERLEASPSFARATDSFGATALHVAATGGATDIIRVLLDRGADLNACDGYDETPLHRAAGTGELCCLIALVDAGAQREATNTSGATPLVVAAKAGQLAACELLLDHGASPCVASPPANLEKLLAERFHFEAPLLAKRPSQSTVSTSEGDSVAWVSPTLSALSPAASERFFMFGDDGIESTTDSK